MSTEALQKLVRRNKADAAELLQIVVMLASAVNQECDKPRQLAYAIGLNDVPLATLRDALPELLKKAKYMPSIAEIRIACGVDVSAEARAALAFEQLDRHAGIVGSYRSVVFDDPVLNATIRSLGGWVEVLATDNREWLSHFRHRFVTTYKSLLEAKQGTMTPLLGISARENAGNGHETQPPVRIACGLPPVPGIGCERPEQIAAKLPATLRLKGPNDQ